MKLSALFVLLLAVIVSAHEHHEHHEHHDHDNDHSHKDHHVKDYHKEKYVGQDVMSLKGSGYDMLKDHKLADYCAAQVKKICGCGKEKDHFLRGHNADVAQRVSKTLHNAWDEMMGHMEKGHEKKSYMRKGDRGHRRRRLVTSCLDQKEDKFDDKCVKYLHKKMETMPTTMNHRAPMPTRGGYIRFSEPNFMDSDSRWSTHHKRHDKNDFNHILYHYVVPAVGGCLLLSFVVLVIRRRRQTDAYLHRLHRPVADMSQNPVIIGEIVDMKKGAPITLEARVLTLG